MGNRTTARSPPSGLSSRVRSPPMRARDVAGDGKPEADAALLQIASLVEAVERAKRLLPPRGGDAGTVVVDENINRTRIGLHRDLDARAVLESIVDEIGETAAQCVALGRQARGPAVR